MATETVQILSAVAFPSRTSRDSAHNALRSTPLTQKILDVCHRHRLIGRLARELEAPQTASAEIVTAVREQQRHIESRAQEHIREVVRVQEYLHAMGHRSVLLKGPSAHLVSGCSIPLRHFEDMDLMVLGTARADASSVIEPLDQLGYELIPEWPCGIHEAGHFVRGDRAASYRMDGEGLEQEAFKLDVHHGFPFWGFPDVPPVDLTSPGRIDIDPQGLGQRTDRRLVDYAALAEEVRCIEMPFGDITVLSPEATALISCGNIFKDYLKPHWLVPSCVRLGEVAEIVDLVSLPGFRYDRFAKLAVAWSATDAIACVTEVYESLVGDAPDVLRDSASGTAHCLTVWNRDHHPVILRTTKQLNSIENRIEQFLTMRNYVAELGENVVTAASTFGPGAVTTVGSEGARAFTHRLRGRTLETEISLAWGTDALVMEMTILNQDAEGSECVLLNFGDPALEIYRPADGSSPRVRNRAPSGAPVAEQVTADWRSGGNGSSILQVAIGWHVLPSRSDGEISFICGLQDLVADDHSRNVSVFAPVRVVRTTEQ
jgi:hypothetical protein